MDRALTIRYLNWTVPDLSREDILGQSVLTLVPPNYQDEARDVYEHVLRDGVSRRFETMYEDASGLRIWEAHVGPIRSEGAVVGLIIITTEVTEQRRASADRNRFFALSLDMFIVVSSKGLLQRVNRAFADALGYEAHALTGKRFLDFVHPEDQELTDATFARVVSGDPIIDFENRFRQKDGSYRVFSWRSSIDPVTGYVYAVARDITDTRATEARLRHVQKMEAVGLLAGGIAHDFNNLMQAVLGNAELALRGVDASSRVSEHLREIGDAGRRASELTKQLLAFSRRQPILPTSIDLNALIGGLMKMLERLLPENIATEFDAEGDLSRVRADGTQLEQVIVNLCVNARDAMKAGGRLVLRTENVTFDEQACESLPWAKAGRYVLLTVTDTGVGMTAEVRERVFEPFFTTKSLHEGTGLGLSTVYGVVEQHGGAVHIDSEVGVGTTIRVYLKAEDHETMERSEKDPAPALARGHETILVAEDEALVRRPLLRLLEEAGYRTIGVDNGIAALHVLRDQVTPVHLVILDVIMPEMSGPETWRQMQSLRPGLRVLFTSGYADGDNLGRLPADAEILTKPYSTRELLRRVRRALDEERSE